MGHGEVRGRCSRAWTRRDGPRSNGGGIEEQTAPHARSARVKGFRHAWSRPVWGSSERRVQAAGSQPVMEEPGQPRRKTMVRGKCRSCSGDVPGGIGSSLLLHGRQVRASCTTLHGWYREKPERIEGWTNQRNHRVPTAGGPYASHRYLRQNSATERARRRAGSLEFPMPRSAHRSPVTVWEELGSNGT